MNINIFFLVIYILTFILTLVYFNNKSVGYFISIIFIFVIISLYLNIQKSNENFISNLTEAENELNKAYDNYKKNERITSDVTELKKNVMNIKDTLKNLTLRNRLERSEETKNYDLIQSQKEQDIELTKLENELDVLLDLYRKESEDVDNNKYNSIAIYNSCKVNDFGKNSKNIMPNMENMIKDIEKSEKYKNMGIGGSMNLFNLMNKDQDDNLEIHIQ